ncbi:MAG: tRNA 4-thiouridine(8) synthase ThiI [Lachnospiraceae bacterium]|nr:tRNA 4-thiouridine(8) synthase ThiI [Lachnospiraceae bacterium]
MKKSLFRTFIIKYAEIGIKGRNRFLFEDALVDRVKNALRDMAGSFYLRKTPGRIFLEMKEDFDFDEVVERLGKVFGTVGIAPTLSLEDEGFDALAQQVVSYWGDMYGDRMNGEKPLTFKVNARRNRKNYPKNSMEINADLGEVLLQAYPQLKVDVHKPEILLEVEIRDRIYVYSEILPGPGGMPVGTGGKAMLLLSGGIDSPVAGWMIAKRGVTLDAVYFNAPPYTSERALQKVVDLATIVSAYTGPINLHVINFTDIQLKIYELCPHEELTIIMRRYMMRIAEKLAQDCGALGLVTGESIGQVASQTMASLVATNEVCTLPVYRPLIAFDKQDIVEISERIGTYETSILPYEDCCTIFVAKHPVTKPNVNVIRRHEHNLDEVIGPLLEAAFETDRIIRVGAEEE